MKVSQDFIARTDFAEANWIFIVEPVLPFNNLNLRLLAGNCNASC